MHNKFYQGHAISLDSNGYERIFKPNHPRAHKDGLVYVHILQAELLLGRYLTKDEIVHHIDFDKTNNKISNLMVFINGTAHRRYHSALKYNLSFELKRIHGVYDCIILDERLFCPLCSGPKNKKGKLCANCRSKINRKNIPTKDVLITELQHNSLLAIGKKYGVSDNAVRKWLKSYDLPYKHTDILNFRHNFTTKICPRGSIGRAADL